MRAPEHMSLTLVQGRGGGPIPWLRSDATTQATVEYQEKGGAMVLVRQHLCYHPEKVSNVVIRSAASSFVVHIMTKTSAVWAASCLSWQCPTSTRAQLPGAVPLVCVSSSARYGGLALMMAVPSLARTTKVETRGDLRWPSR
eukprot:TRINITY_DN11320_c0_g1_i1.p2 TRINITY_DN11320_c0_g1~~TRINITY_DN11320_c0_g1_i1.p2  ORF type:complete len:142 (-),score=18.95 TRINITY_DN11320_c0_g1_i1:713-1138(-)